MILKKLGKFIRAGRNGSYKLTTVRIDKYTERLISDPGTSIPRHRVIICYNVVSYVCMAYNSRSAQRLSSKIVHGNPAKLISIALVLFHTYKMLSEEEAAARTFTARGVITFERSRTPRGDCSVSSRVTQNPFHLKIRFFPLPIANRAIDLHRFHPCFISWKDASGSMPLFRQRASSGIQSWQI